MFTTAHFIWIGICAVLILFLSWLSRRFRFSFRTASLLMAGIGVCSEVSKIISHMEYVNGLDAVDGMVLDAGALPLHLCSMLLFVMFYLPFSRNEKIRSYLCSLFVPVGLIGASLAILMATSGTDFLDPRAYQCFLYHAGMIWFSLYLIFSHQVELGKRAWCRNLLSLLSLAMLMIWVNSALQVYDTNFWYVVRPPAEGLPLLNLDHGWFAYFGALLLCGFLGVTAVHLPFMLREKKIAGEDRL